MNDDFKISLSAPADPEMPTMGMSSVVEMVGAASNDPALQPIY